MYLIVAYPSLTHSKEMHIASYNISTIIFHAALRFRTMIIAFSSDITDNNTLVFGLPVT